MADYTPEQIRQMVRQYYADKLAQPQPQEKQGVDYEDIGARMQTAGAGMTQIASGIDRRPYAVAPGSLEAMSALKQRRKRERQEQEADRMNAIQGIAGLDQQAQAEQLAADDRAYKRQRDALGDARDQEKLNIEREKVRAAVQARADKQAGTRAKQSLMQAKQQGLAEIGNMANSQYEAALRKGQADRSFDPTDPKQFIDNSSWAPKWLKSDAAGEAESAQSAWVESYLRDASGAAIPPSERLSYARDYFPRPGDTPEAVKNKAMLRAQKERNALLAAGSDPIQPQQIQEMDAGIDDLDQMSIEELQAEARRLGLK